MRRRLDGNASGGVVDFYEERRRSHRRHALRVAMAELQDMPAAKTDARLVVKVKPPTPTLDKIKERLRREKKRADKPLRAPLLMLAGENGAQPVFSKKHLDCFYFGNYDQYDAAREYLKTFS